jgi:hypothetical protein
MGACFRLWPNRVGRSSWSRLALLLSTASRSRSEKPRPRARLVKIAALTKRVEPTAGSLVFEWSLVMVTSSVFAAVAHPQRSAEV